MAKVSTNMMRCWLVGAPLLNPGLHNIQRSRVSLSFSFSVLTFPLNLVIISTGVESNTTQ